MDSTASTNKTFKVSTTSDINWEEFREWSLASPRASFRLLGTNKKVDMKNGQGFLTYCLHLAPKKSSVPYGGVDMCKYSVPACVGSCIQFTGRHIMSLPKKRRIERTLWWLKDPETFHDRLSTEIEWGMVQAAKKDLTLACRLDGLSDIGLGQDYCRVYEDVMFYDYTKDFARIVQWKHAQKYGRWKNYHLTFSWSGQNGAECLTCLKHGVNVAVPFWPALPETFLDYPVVDGTYDDRRFLDPDTKGVVIGLLFKGSKKRRDFALKHEFCVEVLE